MADEAELIDRLVADWQAGIDREGNFRRLFDRYYRSVYRFFEKRGIPADECHDLTQETFIRVYRGMGTFRQEARFETWLFTIAAHTFQKALRHQSAHKRAGRHVPVEHVVAQEWASSSDEDGPVGYAFAAGPLDEVLEKERRRVLRAAMDELPDQMRKCVGLRVDQELSYAEIAVVLRISVETVKAHLFQARQRLKVKLAGYFAEVEW